MTSKILASVVCVSAAVAFAGAEGARQEPVHSPTPSIEIPGRFTVLLKCSIFASDGVASTRRAGGIPVAAATPILVLRGVVVENGEYTAILEDPASHQIQHLKEGATIGSGRLVHLGLRGFDYVNGLDAMQVAVGKNLHGDFAAPVAPPATTPPAAVAKAAPPGNTDSAVQAAAMVHGPTTMPAAVGAVSERVEIRGAAIN